MGVSGPLESLYMEVFGSKPETVEPLPAHGSNRRYYRLRGAGGEAIGALNPDGAENRAFLELARHFGACGLPVPTVFAENEAAGAYLQEDLGDQTLFDHLKSSRGPTAAVPPEVADYYRQAIRWLPRFQIQATRGLNWSICHPHHSFDRQSMQWDLNYFKYYFLRLADVPFHEKSLEDDFAALIDHLAAAPAAYFLYRDFQSRNIMIKDGRTWFIDFQGGRRGSLPYDVASLLLDAKADLPYSFRDELLDEYLAAAQTVAEDCGMAANERQILERENFRASLAGFALIRLLQAFGAYGFRGFHEQKTHFLQSVPYALRNLERILDPWLPSVELPHLRATLARATRLTRLREIAPVTVSLEVQIISFSYRRGYPADESGHGGGYVFDCRNLPNPGRCPEFMALDGRDPAVAAWLDSQEETARFLSHVRALLHQTVTSYQRRNFTHLTVSFGCTGGQHRSVYCAEQTALWLRGLPQVTAGVQHRELVPASQESS